MSTEDKTEEQVKAEKIMTQKTQNKITEIHTKYI